MDDLLKRMLGVEQEADRLVASAQDETKRILADARRRANELASAEQSESASEVTAVLSAAVSAAESRRSACLREAEASCAARAAGFTAEIRRNCARVSAVLLGLSEG